MRNWLITGCRSGHKHVDRALDALVNEYGRPGIVILGDQRGVDTQAHQWCERNEVDYAVHFARWKESGPAGGPMRNGRMAARLAEVFDGGQDVAIGFPGKESVGTWEFLQKPILSPCVLLMVDHEGALHEVTRQFCRDMYVKNSNASKRKGK